MKKKWIMYVAAGVGLLVIMFAVALQSDVWATVNNRSEVATTTTGSAVVIEENDIDCVKLDAGERHDP